MEILFSYNPHVEELCQLPRTRTDAARDSEDGHCPHERGPQRDCFDGVPLNRGLVPIFTLDDEEILRLTTELVPAGDHFDFKFGESFVAKT